MFKKTIILVLIFSFGLSSPSLPRCAYADELLVLPQPGKMVGLTRALDPILIKGIKIHPENPFLFDFILSLGEHVASKDVLQQNFFKKEADRLIKYFLTALTIPEKDLWVNLSPYEKDRMIASNLGQTVMGRDMLVQDYMLKQLTASLMYPEQGLGQKFWDRVYTKAREFHLNANIPVNAFNKVWIIADQADVFERGQTVYVVGAHLKVMLDEDYLAAKKAVQQPGNASTTKTVLKQIVLPELEREVNQGVHFTALRQMFYAMILASWYKKSLKNALLGKVYANKSKVAGVTQEDVKANEAIFTRYLQAYKKGVFSYIKNVPLVEGRTEAVKYFAGGLKIWSDMMPGPRISHDVNAAMAIETSDDLVDVSGHLVVPAPLRQASEMAWVKLASPFEFDVGKDRYELKLIVYKNPAKSVRSVSAVLMKNDASFTPEIHLTDNENQAKQIIDGINVQANKDRIAGELGAFVGLHSDNQYRILREIYYHLGQLAGLPNFDAGRIGDVMEPSPDLPLAAEEKTPDQVRQEKLFALEHVLNNLKVIQHGKVFVQLMAGFPDNDNHYGENYYLRVKRSLDLDSDGLHQDGIYHRGLKLKGHFADPVRIHSDLVAYLRLWFQMEKDFIEDKNELEVLVHGDDVVFKANFNKEEVVFRKSDFVDVIKRVQARLEQMVFSGPVAADAVLDINGKDSSNEERYLLLLMAYLTGFKFNALIDDRGVQAPTGILLEGNNPQHVLSDLKSLLRQITGWIEEASPNVSAQQQFAQGNDGNQTPYPEAGEEYIQEFDNKEFQPDILFSNDERYVVIVVGKVLLYPANVEKFKKSGATFIFVDNNRQALAKIEELGNKVGMVVAAHDPDREDLYRQMRSNEAVKKIPLIVQVRNLVPVPQRQAVIKNYKKVHEGRRKGELTVLFRSEEQDKLLSKTIEMVLAGWRYGHIGLAGGTVQVDMPAADEPDGVGRELAPAANATTAPADMPIGLGSQVIVRHGRNEILVYGQDDLLASATVKDLERRGFVLRHIEQEQAEALPQDRLAAILILDNTLPVEAINGIKNANHNIPVYDHVPDEQGLMKALNIQYEEYAQAEAAGIDFPFRGQVIASTYKRISSLKLALIPMGNILGDGHPLRKAVSMGLWVSDLQLITAYKTVNQENQILVTFYGYKNNELIGYRQARYANGDYIFDKPHLIKKTAQPTPKASRGAGTITLEGIAIPDDVLKKLRDQLKDSEQLGDLRAVIAYGQKNVTSLQKGIIPFGYQLPSGKSFKAYSDFVGISNWTSIGFGANLERIVDQYILDGEGHIVGIVFHVWRDNVYAGYSVFGWNEKGLVLPPRVEIINQTRQRGNPTKKEGATAPKVAVDAPGPVATAAVTDEPVVLTEAVIPQHGRNEILVYGQDDLLASATVRDLESRGFVLRHITQEQAENSDHQIPVYADLKDEQSFIKALNVQYEEYAQAKAAGIDFPFRGRVIASAYKRTSSLKPAMIPMGNILDDGHPLRKAVSMGLGIGSLQLITADKTINRDGQAQVTFYAYKDNELIGYRQANYVNGDYVFNQPHPLKKAVTQQEVAQGSNTRTAITPTPQPDVDRVDNVFYRIPPERKTVVVVGNTDVSSRIEKLLTNGKRASFMPFMRISNLTDALKYIDEHKDRIAFVITDSIDGFEVYRHIKNQPVRHFFCGDETIYFI